MAGSAEPILDFHGRIMFYCAACGVPMTQDDFFEMGMRLPDHGESKDDYFDAELLQSLSHVDCLRAARAS